MSRKLTLRIPDTLSDRLKAAAERECISLNALIVRVLAGLQPAPKEVKDSAPVCSECDEPMNRFMSTVHGISGWGCDLCGWTIDDEPAPKRKPAPKEPK